MHMTHAGGGLAALTTVFCRHTDRTPAPPLQALGANSAAGRPAPDEAVAAYAAHYIASTSFPNGEHRHAPKMHATPSARR